MHRYALRWHTYTCTQPMLLQTNLSRHSKIWGGISFPRWNLQSATHTNNTYHQHNFNHSLQAKHAPHKLSHKQKYHLDIINWYANTPFSNSYTQKQSNHSSMQFTTTTEHHLFYPVMHITNITTLRMLTQTHLKFRGLKLCCITCVVHAMVQIRRQPMYYKCYCVQILDSESTQDHKPITG